MKKLKSKVLVRTVSLILGLLLVAAIIPSQARAETIELENISWNLGVTPGGLFGEKQGNTYYFTAHLGLRTPDGISRDTRVVDGPRDTVPIGRVGLGILETASIEKSCKPSQTKLVECNFPFTIPSSRMEHSIIDSEEFSIVIDDAARVALDLTNKDLRTVELTVMPYVQLESGTAIAFADSVQYLAFEDSQGRVLQGSTVTSILCGAGINPLCLAGAAGVYAGKKVADVATNVAFTGLNLILTSIIKFVNELIYLIFSFFIVPFIEALLGIRTYTDTFASIIYPAWEVFRNLGNIIFILAIIATGLATVFRVGGWQAKDILVKLVIAAILINFSLVIAQAVLGVADTVQNQFLPIKDSGAIRLLGKQLMLAGSDSAWQDLSTSSPTSFGTFGQTVRVAANFIAAFISFIAFVAICLFLLIRIVFLWLLLMTSPIPYVAMVLPVTRGVGRRWWKNFIKFAFMTPAMAFMLNLTALIAQRSQTIVSDLANKNYGQMSGNVERVMFALGANAIVIVMLYVSLTVARTIGAESGGLVEKVTKTGLRAAIGGPKFVGSFANLQKQKVGNIAAEKGGFAGKLFSAALSPVTTSKAIKARLDANKKEVQEKTAAHAKYFADNVSPLSTTIWKTGYNKVRKFAKLKVGSAVDRIDRLEKMRNVKTDAEIAEFKGQMKIINDEHKPAIDKGSLLRPTDIERSRKAFSDYAAVQEVKLKDNKDLIDGVKAQIRVASEKQDAAAIAKHQKELQNLEGEQKKIIADRDNMKVAEEKFATKVKDAQKTPGQAINVADIKGELHAALEVKKDLLQDEIDKDDAARKALNIRGEYNDKQRDQAAKELQEFQSLQINSKLPQAKVAKEFRNRKTAEQERNLDGTEEFDDLVGAFHAAIARGQKEMALAVMQKIEKGGDMPDFLNSLNFSADLSGKQKFFEEYVEKKMGFDHTQAMLIAAESDRRNKANGLYNLSDSVKYDKQQQGRVWRDASEQIAKSVARALGDKAPAAALSSSRKDFIFIADPSEPQGKRLNPAYIQVLQSVSPRDISRGGNPLIAKELSTNWRRDLEEAGVSSEIIQALEERAAGKGGKKGKKS